MGDKLLRKNSLYFNWLFSYISIMMVPIIICGIIYFRSENVIENETNRANSAMLRQLQQTIDNQLNQIEQLGTQISLSSRVTSALRVNDSFDASDQFNLLKLREELNLYKAFNSYIEDIYIYLQYTDSIAGIKSVTKTKEYYEINYGGDANYAVWKHMLQKPHKKEYKVIHTISSTQEPRHIITYMQSLPMLYSDYRGTLVLEIDDTKILDIVNNIQWVNKGILVILDEQDQVIINTQSLNLTELNYSESSLNTDEITYTNISGEKYVISYATSESNQWKYMMLVPTNIFWEKVEYIRKIMFVSIIICIILGAVIVLMLTKRNYNPIKKIVQAIAKKDFASLNSKYAEYRYICKVINDTQDEKNEITNTLKQKDIVIRDNVLVRFLIGNTEMDSQVEKIFHSIGIDSKNSNFGVILFSLDNITPLYMSSTYVDNKEDIDKVKLVLSSAIQKQINTENNLIMIDVGDVLACIVSLKEKNDDEYNYQIIKLANEAKRRVVTNINLHFSAASGNLHKGIYGIIRSYKEALDALEARAFMGHGDLIQYNEISNNSLKYYYTMSFEHKFMNLIKHGDYENAKNLLEEMFESMFDKKIFSIELSKCLMFDITSTFIKASDSLNDIKFIAELDPFKRLSGCTTVKEMREAVSKMLKLLCEHIEKNNIETETQFSKQLDEYIIANYHNVNLNLQIIADHFNITPSYLSKLYKEQTGEKILDTLNIIRLERSKHHLNKSNVSIKEISQKVGFSNSNVYIRTFKKYEGITPGQLRKSIFESKRIK